MSTYTIYKLIIVCDSYMYPIDKLFFLDALLAVYSVCVGGEGAFSVEYCEKYLNQN